MQDAKAYRARFVQLVAQLDTVTRSVNLLAADVKKVREPKVLDYYESTLRILETLLAAISRLTPFGGDPAALDSAFFLVRDCRQRVGRTQQAFKEAMQGREIKALDLFKQTEAEPLLATGCYFCSRPVIEGRFAQVRVRIDGEILEVMSCRVCKEELEATRKVKVLYFMKDSKPVHWSKMTDYRPSEDFWNINQREPVRRERKLELVRTDTPEQT